MKVVKKSWVLLLLVLMLTVTACSGGAGNKPKEEGAETNGAGTTDKVTLRIMWWGSQARHDATLKVIDLFQDQYPNITISPEYMGNDGYFDKLATQIAGGNPPDLMQLGNNYPDYVSKDALLDISPYVGKEVNVADFDQNVIEAGAMDGKQYGISLGSNVLGLVYNKSLLEQAGLQPPAQDMTWEDLKAYGQDAVAKLGDGKFAFAGQSFFPHYFNYFLRQQDKALYRDGEVGFGQEDAEAWMNLWNDFSEAGIIPSSEASASMSETSPDVSLLVQGKVLMSLVWSNQMSGFQSAMNDEIGISLLPKAADQVRSGLWVQPSQFMTISKESKHPKEAAMFIDFMVNDPEATQILGNDRGIPGSGKVRSALSAAGSDIDKKIYEYFNIAAENASPMDRELPNIGEFDGKLNNAAMSVGFGAKTPAEAAADILAAAEDAVNKSK
ncbi:ABC transporter substrate-binding protein [Paenibacillus macerans]|uniref:ABC transporter substrate-binding protein n=1 Tax=Paenibacillus macerans TaxID=44252 RepID=UPI00203A3AB7|nr:sugar ABC transporter substrate-binding protein [Paenibacillus macerans]MCM3702039.1 sugar ABC transporter substrate-binding protein [Paenibacillus macerans]